MTLRKFDYLIVGAGLFGSTFAWHATQSGKTCLVVEFRNHIGGNCYTEEVSGVCVHKYGPHIFHTSDEQVWKFINKFANFNDYVHRIKAFTNGKFYSLPFNLGTINALDSNIQTPAQAEAWLIAKKNTNKVTNLEEHCIAMIGKELYEHLVLGYTFKQWGRHPSTLPSSLIKRLPIRTTFNDNYFNDKYQGIPIGGYTQIFEKLLQGSVVELNVDFFENKTKLESISNKTIYTGQLDKFFESDIGSLEYRTLDFTHTIHNVPDYQGCSIINYPSIDVAWTRIVEHKHFEPNANTDNQNTVVTIEIPREWKIGDEPYYPIPDVKNSKLAEIYKKRAKNENRTIFGGRLGTYQYYDMHQIIAQAQSLAMKIL